LGKHSLTNTEKWSAINAVSALGIGIFTMIYAGFIESAGNESGAFMIGMICLSLALPLGHIAYPIQLKGKHWKELYAVALIGIGLLAILSFFVMTPVAVALFAVYGIGFLIYNWAGLIR
jgi:hypothetical protein